MSDAVTLAITIIIPAAPALYAAPGLRPARPAGVQA
jgi:hypothetical protein